MAIPTWPRIRFDLTRHEPVVDDPVRRSILHSYPDALPADALLQTYSIEELLAEKTRALVERARPRDLWDVVFLVDNAGQAIQLAHAREVFVEKCAAKSFEAPSAEALCGRAREDMELASEWDNMLAHQLPQLPTVSSVLDRLAGAVAWIDLEVPATVTAAAIAPPAITAKAGEELVAAAGVAYWRGADVLERIRYAGASRLCVQFSYKGERRLVEPYSLRRARSTGNVLLYAHDLNRNAIRSFATSEIRDLEVTTRSFVPRYKVEFLATGSIAVSETAPRSAYTFRYATSRPRRRTYSYSGQTYVFECPYCRKEFRHRRNDPSLRRHKMPDGWGYCSGRRGYFVRTIASRAPA